jgi:serine/threonine-protein kinase
VFSVDPVVGQPYLAMEYVDGPSLSAMLKSGGPLPFESADGLRQRLASGLHSAHELGIIHRDMSRTT